MLTPEQLDAISKLGVVASFAIAIWAFATERVVPGGAHKRVIAERDAAYQRLSRFLDVIEAATGVKPPQ